MLGKASRHIVPMLVAMLGLVACGAATAPLPAPAAAPAAHVILSGSGGGSTLLKHIVAPYQAGEPALTLEFLQGSGSGPAKQAALEGKLDGAILLSANSAGEQQEGLELLPLAEDPVAFVVNGDLPIASLTQAQLREIYRGTIVNWRAVGGPDAAIIVLARDEDEGSTKILRKALFGDAPWVSSAIVLTKAGDLTDAVKDTPNSIGFGSYGGFVLGADGLSVVAVDAVHPRDYGSGRYAFPARTLALMYTPASQQRLQPLLDYLKSEAARAAMLEAGIVPLP